MLDEIPPKQVLLRMEPAAILAAVQTQRGQFQRARVFTAVIEVLRQTFVCTYTYVLWKSMKTVAAQ